MRILYTITGYPPAIGGAQLYTHQLASRFVCGGHKVRVATCWDETRTDWLLGTTLRAPARSREYFVEGVPVHRLGLSRAEKARLVPFVLGYWALQGLSIRQIVRVLRPKLEALGGGWQLVHNVRQGREGLSFASLDLARRLEIPFVFTPVHHPRWGGWLHRHYHALYRAADAVIALTQAEKRILIGLGVPEGRIHVTGMGPVLSPSADGDRFRSKFGLGNDPVILFLGTHHPYKGVGALLLAAHSVWERFPAARFLFVGAATGYSRRLFARTSPDPRLQQLGPVDLQTKSDALAACDLLCVPSLQESFGGVYTEAWMMGKPVIGGDIPAVREVISDGEDGFLVRQHPGELAANICRLLEDSGLRERMGRQGKQKVLSHYSWDRLAERTEQIYSHLLSGREGAGR